MDVTTVFLKVRSCGTSTKFDGGYAFIVAAWPVRPTCFWGQKAVDLVKSPLCR
ncbi:hypothetical protein ACSSV1_000901 [Labrenzia sp. MBR-25]